ncbi:MAG: hypothetical protein KA100_04590 [Rickettsiales bacterium]|nr:hypothetical protein [Rickettsiales bacterium]
MPHLIIEHSADIKKTSVKNLEQELQNVMNALIGDFKADECKTRSLSFDEYFVGRPDQSLCIIHSHHNKSFNRTFRRS